MGQPAARAFLLAPHHCVLHLELSDGGQDERHGHAEQRQLRGQQSTGLTLPLLTLQELQTALELQALEQIIQTEPHT